MRRGGERKQKGKKRREGPGGTTIAFFCLLVSVMIETNLSIPILSLLSDVEAKEQTPCKIARQKYIKREGEWFYACRPLSKGG
jgi:hypothetical protein